MRSRHPPSAPAPAALPDIDPEVARFVNGIATYLAAHDLERLPLAEVRVLCEAARAPWVRGGPAVQASERVVAATSHPVRIRRYDPAPGNAKPALVYLHGGGWTLFSIDTHDRLMREYAARAGIAVIGVDYALAPEHRFPVALEQVVGVLRWLSQHGEELGVDTARLAVGGDSSGANLAVAACIALRDAGDARLVRAMLINYGAFDVDCDEESRRRYGGPGHMLTDEEMRGFWNNYLREATDSNDPLACPLKASPHGLPAAFFTIAEYDLLAAQNLAMAARLEAAGVAVTSVVYPRTPHSFLEAISVAKVSARAVDDAAGWLRRALRPEAKRR